MGLLANLFTGIFGKYIVAGVGVVGLVGALALGWMYIQLQQKDYTILQQTQTIKDQKTTIDTLTLVNDIRDKSNKILSDRVDEIVTENQELQDKIDAINAEPPEKDGPVAPILKDVLK